LAPAALVAGFIALILVVSTSGDGEESSEPERARPARTTTTATAPVQRPAPPQRPARFYTVKPGDILSTIAVQTGVPAQQIEDLNPEVDPQGLVPGQRLRVRP
jgi:LysM repeat protein